MSFEPLIKIPFGPQHPALKEPAHFLFEIEGEKIVSVKPRIGYAHRGVEKAFESKTYLQNIYLAERICGICSDAHTTCYTQAIEELLDVKIPPRARYIRVLIAELERIQSHALWIGLAAHEIGFDTLFMYVWRDREIILDIFEQISGNRIHYAMNTIGGVRRNINAIMGQHIKKKANQLEQRIKYYFETFQKEPTILQRTKNVGVLKSRDARRLGTLGPTLRASGIKNDVRKDDPYIAYDEVPFEVITHDGCDVLSRMIVRSKEICESLGIINYVLDHLPDGDIKVKTPLRVPEGEAVSRVEAPRGELIHYVKSKGTTKPDRYKIRSPTLGNIPSLCKMLEGQYIADIPIILAGIDPCFSCMDRMAFVDTKTHKEWIWSLQQIRKRRKNDEK